jgi:hypothetical protein
MSVTTGGFGRPWDRAAEPLAECWNLATRRSRAAA